MGLHASHDATAKPARVGARGGDATVKLSAETRRVWPPRLVHVLEGGIWRCAQMEAWRVGQTGHQVRIRYRVDNHRMGDLPLVWVDVARVRPRGERKDNAP